MAKNQTYRAFVARPSHILDLNGELLEAPSILKLLASEIRDVSGYATYVARNDTVLGERLATVTVSAPAEAGRQAGITLPDFLASGRTGRSRKEKLVQYNVVVAYRSWQERVKAANGESSRYVSQGWRRTADGSAPSYGGDYVNLGAVDMILPSCPARTQATRLEASVLADQDTHDTLGTNKAALKQGNMTYKRRLYSPI